MCSKEGESPTDKEELGITDVAAAAEDAIISEDIPHLKEKKKKKHHRGEKRKRSCSTDSTSSNSSHKRHKKKKKKKSKDDPPSPKVNPIFLWVKQDHTKIVEVLCEDYDKRNRIKLTKTPGGWVAIPRTNMFCPETPKETKDVCFEPKEVHSFPKEDVPKQTVNLSSPNKEIHLPQNEVPVPKENVSIPLEELPVPKHEREEAKQPEVQETVEEDIEDLPELVIDEKDIEIRKEPECTEIKCCPEVNVDENHNNEVESVEECMELGKSLEGGEMTKGLADDDMSKNLEDDVEEVKVPDDSPDDEPIEVPDDDEEDSFHQENCVNLMNELADLCFVENMKEEDHDKDLEDMYTFVPSPVPHKGEVNALRTAKNEQKVSTPEPSPINLVVHPEREEDKDGEKGLKVEPLKQSDLENLEILWRIPEGTTISHSKPLPDAKPATPTLKPVATFTQPMQEEPLSLCKPKPKEEKKPPKPAEDSKLMELLRSDDKTQSNPLEQLKEVLSDPDLSVPDPLLVPRARLSALIANPAKEIPKLLAQKREIKYPRLDADLMVVSLAHLQSILQKTGKEDDLKLYQQQIMTGCDKIDPAAAAINQMLWPYLTQLEVKHNQELMAMLYPHYALYPQHYAMPSPATSFPYPSPAWPWPETSKPKPASKHHDLKHQDFKRQDLKHQEFKQQEFKQQEFKLQGFKHQDFKLQDFKHQDFKLQDFKHQDFKHQDYKHPDFKHQDFKHQDFKLQDFKLQDFKHPDCKHPDFKHPDFKLHDFKHHDFKQHEPKKVEQRHQESKVHDVNQLHHQSHQSKEASPKPKLKVRDNLVEPKLKVRDNLVEPNQRTNLLKFDPTSPFLPPVGVPPNSNLWHPLFSSPDGKYTSRWNWTTPVTVSGE